MVNPFRFGVWVEYWTMNNSDISFNFVFDFDINPDFDNRYFKEIGPQLYNLFGITNVEFKVNSITKELTDYIQLILDGKHKVQVILKDNFNDLNIHKHFFIKNKIVPIIELDEVSDNKKPLPTKLFSLIDIDFNVYISVLSTDNISEYLDEINNDSIKAFKIIHPKKFEYDKVDSYQILNELDKIKNNNNLNFKTFVFPYLEEQEVHNYYKPNKSIRSFLSCFRAWFSLTINENGQVSVCDNSFVGSIFENSLAEIFNGQQHNNLREEIIKKKQFDRCKNCHNFYLDNLLIVDNKKVEYKGKVFEFESELNYTKSAPSVGLYSEANNLVSVEPLFGKVPESRMQDLLFILK